MIDIYLLLFIFYGVIIVFKSIFLKKINKYDKNSLDVLFLVIGIFFYDFIYFWFWIGYMYFRNWIEYNIILDRNVFNKKGKSGKYMCIYKY